MSKKNDGGPAFPFCEQDVGGSPITASCYGMSLRDWFAAHAPPAGPEEGLSTAEHAEWCYEYADAMLAEREK